MAIVSVGIDLAKNVFAVHGVDESGKPALLSTIGNGRDFKCGRQLCAWLGLVPGQYSSGGKQRLGRITKADDPYLRSLLVLGARAVLAAARTSTCRPERQGRPSQDNRK